MTSFRDDAEVHPPMDYAGYKSTALRHPKQPLIALPHRLTEITAPVFGDERVRRATTTTSRASTRASRSASGSSSTATSRRTTGAPVPDTLVEIWQANAGGRYRHRGRQLAVAAGPELHRRAGAR